MSVEGLDGGVNKYFAHPTTRMACAVLKVDDQYHVWRQDEPVPEAFVNAARDRVLVAHNAPFDSKAWDKFVGVEARWFDTVPCCRAHGLPGRLEDVGKSLFGRGKDPAGKRLIDMISKVKVRGGTPQFFVGNSLVWDQFVEYCRRDVELLSDAYEIVKDSVEPEVMSVDRAINDRGVPVFRPLLEHLADVSDYNAAKSNLDFAELTEGKNPRSPKQVLAWFLSQGFDMRAVNKTTLMELFKNPTDFFEGDADSYPEAFAGVVEAVALRGELVRTGGSKLSAALRLEDGGRILDQFVYWGAHTGRWSGRGMQFQNLPNMMEHVDVHKLLTESTLDYDTLKAAAEAATIKMREGNPHATCYVGSVVNSLIKACVRGSKPLSVLDFGAVEARCVAWMARSQRMLDIFADDKRDLYAEFAEDMYGFRPKKEEFERFVAKQIILGCGYGMSWAGFKRSFTLFLNAHAGTLVKRGFAIGDEEAKAFVNKYRMTFPEVPKLWKECGDAAMKVVRRQSPSEAAGRCDFFMENADFAVRLPSGRKLRFRNVRIEDRQPAWAKFQNVDIKVPTIVFDHPHGYAGFLYGGRLVENLAQAICRDMLAEAAVNCEKEKLDPCLHVHDELMCESDNIKRMAEIMSTPPSWAPSFPVLVDGYTGNYWTRQTRGFKGCKALNGRVL